jgi:hypothetical protein
MNTQQFSSSRCGILLGRLGGVALSVWVMGGAAGCVSSSKPEEPQTRATTWMLPVVTPQTETQNAQAKGGIEKGGIEITVIPKEFKAVSEEKLNYVQKAPPRYKMLVGVSSGPPPVYVDWTKETEVRVEPEEIKFLVKINNKLPRVFHGAGTVVRFNVGGQLRT